MDAGKIKKKSKNASEKEAFFVPMKHDEKYIFKKKGLLSLGIVIYYKKRSLKIARKSLDGKMERKNTVSWKIEER